MTLKTLNDIEINVDDLEIDVVDGIKAWNITEQSLKDQLKQEAIKYLKSIENLDDNWDIPTEEEKMIIKAEDFIKHFFNIKEKDLK